MCDYSLHAVASRPAKVGETLISTTFQGTSTRGFASENERGVAVCMLPGTELAFAENVRYFTGGSGPDNPYRVGNSARSSLTCRTATMTRSSFRTAAECR